MSDATTSLLSVRSPSQVEEPSLYEGIAVYRQPSPSPLTSSDTLHTTPLSSSGAKLFTPPVLTPPGAPVVTTPPKKASRSAEYWFITIMDDMHACSENLIASATTAMSDISRQLRELSTEKLEKLQKVAEKSRQMDFWSIMQRIGECLLAAINFVVGTALVATGASAVVGSVMIAAGMLSIVNFAMKETEGWDWIAKQFEHDEERRNRITFWISSAFSVLAATLSLGGAAATLAWTQLGTFRRALTILQTGVSLYQGGVAIGKGMTESQVLLSEAELTALETKTTLTHLEFEKRSSNLKAILRLFEESKAQAEQIINLAVNARQKVLQA